MKYKLVPVKPTPEMIHAGQMAVSGFPRDVLERWQAMLAAAPAVEQKPYAYEYGLDNGDGAFSVVINKGSFAQLKENEFGYLPPFDTASKEHPVTPLYLHPQQAPEASVLVEALEVVKTVLESDDPAIADTIWVPGHVSQSETLYDHTCSALAEYRAQGGDV